MLKILFINQPGPEYAQSQLYHGLKSLGHIVWDYPYNQTFHFEELKECNVDCSIGPCNQQSKIGCTRHSAHLTLKDYPQMPLDIERVIDQIDLVVTNNGFGYEELYKLLKHIPIAVLDLGDSKHSSYDIWCKCIGKEPTAFFRREYQIGQKGHPLTYSFYRERSKFPPYRELKYNMSCMFRPTNIMRQEIIDSIKTVPELFIGTLQYSDYLNRISESKFVLDLPGAGITCVRTSEIAGRGSVIVRPQQKEVFIEHDFKDMLNCVEYTSKKELLEKIEYLLKNRVVYDYLRLNSWAHYHAYYTTEARASELLTKVGL